MSATDFHPELRLLGRLLPRRVMKTSSLPRQRKITGLLTKLDRDGRAVPVEQVNDDVTVRLFAPSAPSAARGAGSTGVLWIHGGGYVIGQASMDDKTARAYADRLGATVASVEYRLAPEFPFPTPLEDCYAALTWLAARPGIKRVVIAGASAGGGLAAALAQLAHDRGEVAVAAQILVYPMLDDRTATRAGIERAHRLWTNGSNRIGWRLYTGHEPGSAEMPEYAVPARRADLAGLPPAWIGVGTADLFHDEDLAYAERLQAAGVPVVLEIVPGAFHAFDVLRRGAGVSKAFLDSQLRVAAEFL